jgi:hypothetical protein
MVAADHATSSSRPAVVRKIVQNEALIEAGPSLPLIERLDDSTGGSIYYGTGVTTPRAISVGVPFDVLGMVLIAERLRRAADFDLVYHHIADTHATTNAWIDPDAVIEVADRTQETLRNVCANLGLDHFRIVRASTLETEPQYLSLLRHFNGLSNEHEYVRRELADMEWYRRTADVRLKLGWIIQAKETDIGFDERRFDREYLRTVGPDLSFIYVKPGRTFDPSRPKVSPYVSVQGESRLLLQPGIDVAEVIEQAVRATGDVQLGGARKHLNHIVRLYEALFGALGRLPLEEKVQHILNECFCEQSR